MRDQGWIVNYAQEDRYQGWNSLCEIDNPEAVDFVLWTRTGWDYTHPDHGDYRSQEEALLLQHRFLSRMRRAGVPVIGYHLDLWWGLRREHQVLDEPFFQCDLVVTADGGSDEKWAEAGVNHHWMPPGVSAPECELGMFRSDMTSDIAFVGSWQGHYHEESQHRFELVRWLQSNFGNRCRFWPEAGQPAVRGAALRDLYQSVKVVVGDSCLVGTGHANYWSDRIPETLGRGGFLIHPDVPGLEREFTPLVDLVTYKPYVWDQLGDWIEKALSTPETRREVAEHGRQWVLANHTYEVRMVQLLDLLREKGLVKR